MKIPILPHAAGTVRALSQIGYRPETAICDLIDNSIQAGATLVDIHINLKTEWLSIRDNGQGMTSQAIVDALTYGKKSKGSTSLGKFGMGLKTASTSLGKHVRIFSKTEEMERVSETFELDVDAIEKGNVWEIESKETDPKENKEFQKVTLKTNPEDAPVTGTQIRIEKLNNLLDREYQDHTGKPFEKAEKAFIKNLRETIGKTYFHYINTGIKLCVGAKACEPINLIEGADLKWEKTHTLTGVEKDEELNVKIFEKAKDTGVFIYRENRLIEGGNTGYGIKSGSGTLLVFEFNQGLDNILEVDLQKSKIERLKIDSSIIQEIEVEIKQLKKVDKAEEENPTGITTENITNVEDAIEVEVPKKEPTVDELNPEQLHGLKKFNSTLPSEPPESESEKVIELQEEIRTLQIEKENSIDESDAESIQAQIDKDTIQLSRLHLEQTSTASIIKRIIEAVEKLDQEKLNKTLEFVKTL